MASGIMNADSLSWLQNDTITINVRFRADHLIKLSISHALSQSTKLCVFEERVLEIVQQTRDLPEALASTGTLLRLTLQSWGIYLAPAGSCSMFCSATAPSCASLSSACWRLCSRRATCLRPPPPLVSSSISER